MPSEKFERIFRGFTKLDDIEKRKFIILITSYNEERFDHKRKHIVESIFNKDASIVLGPSSAGCPCCGK